MRPCTHCKNPHHSRSSCFQIIGYPEWYVEKSEKQKNHQTHNVATDETYTDFSSEEDVTVKHVANMGNSVRNKNDKERVRSKGKIIADSPLKDADILAFAGVTSFVNHNAPTYTSTSSKLGNISQTNFPSLVRNMIQ